MQKSVSTVILFRKLYKQIQHNNRHHLFRVKRDFVFFRRNKMSRIKHLGTHQSAIVNRTQLGIYGKTRCWTIFQFHLQVEFAPKGVGRIRQHVIDPFFSLQKHMHTGIHHREESHHAVKYDNDIMWWCVYAYKIVVSRMMIAMS